MIDCPWCKNTGSGVEIMPQKAKLDCDFYKCLDCSAEYYFDLETENFEISSEGEDYLEDYFEEEK